MSFLELEHVIEVLVVVEAREKGMEKSVELIWSRWRCWVGMMLVE